MITDIVYDISNDLIMKLHCRGDVVVLPYNGSTGGISRAPVVDLPRANVPRACEYVFMCECKRAHVFL